MERNGFMKTDAIPLLASNYVSNKEKGKVKHYFELVGQGCLRSFHFENGCWQVSASNIFNRQIDGFDLAIDPQGKLNIFAYANEGDLFYLPYLPSQSSESTPEILYQDKNKKITHLASCLDLQNRLHILYLTISAKQEKWWLQYLCQKNGKWGENIILDFGYSQLEQYGLIFEDFRHNIYILYRLYEQGKYCLVFRALELEEKEARGRGRGRTYYLPQKEKECFFPDFMVAPDNTLHISWISGEDKIMFLNYMQRNAAGRWSNHFRMEVSQGSLPLATLYRKENMLIICLEKGGRLFYLFSENEGKNWKWAKNNFSAEKVSGPVRLRTTLNSSAEAKRWGNFSFTAGSLPQGILEPEIFINNIEKEKGNLEEEFQILNVLSSSLLTRAGNLQASNTYLKQRVQQQEKELFQLHSRSIAQKEEMEERLAAKNMEIEKLEALFKNTLKEIQKRMNREKEELTAANKELSRQITTLQNENRELRKNDLLQSAEIARLKEEIRVLTAEKKKVQADKNRFLARLFCRQRE